MEDGQPSVIRKFVYFPPKHERRDPYIIYVSRLIGDEYAGSNILREVEQHRFAFYARRRCQLYSEALWEAVRMWIEKREALEVEYERLRQKGV